MTALVGVEHDAGVDVLGDVELVGGELDAASRLGGERGLEAALQVGIVDVVGEGTHGTVHLVGIGAQRGLHHGLAAVEARSAAAERGVAPVPAPLDDVVEHLGIVAEEVGSDPDRPQDRLEPAAHEAAQAPELRSLGEPVGKRDARIQVVEPLGRLDPGHIVVAEVPQGPFEERREGARVRVADDDHVALRVLQGVAQVARLETDVRGAGQVVDALLLRHRPHLRPPSVVESVDADVDGVRIGHRLGVAQRQAHELDVLVVRGEEDVHDQRPILARDERRDVAARARGGCGSGSWVRQMLRKKRSEPKKARVSATTSGRAIQRASRLSDCVQRQWRYHVPNARAEVASA